MTDDPEACAARHVSMRRVLALFAPFRVRIAGVMTLMVRALAIGLAGPFVLRAITRHRRAWAFVAKSRMTAVG
ncbi:hypothetical protein [uncultured Pseudosulfitobacter sp.]|uniref:hypothetical protein n=1 Tax=uncultured Pseudosulfitobacter sp. TaxID=2854214 RepID=UPI0030DBAE64|tara:strand:- start:330 stop:548 length:219 start_codon:yes stop_codon:yes gene_type:complete